MRTRMYGGVGGAESRDSPLSRFWRESSGQGPTQMRPASTKRPLLFVICVYNCAEIHRNRRVRRCLEARTRRSASLKRPMGGEWKRRARPAHLSKSAKGSAVSSFRTRWGLKSTNRTRRAITTISTQQQCREACGFTAQAGNPS
jgi:hypothetical protein